MMRRDQWVRLLATGFGSGNIPVAPGTFGSLVGLGLCYGFSLLPGYWAIVVLLGVLIPVSVGLAHSAAKQMGEKDPGCIVIDEIAGMAVTLIGIPWSATAAIGGFVLFRILDILKPFPVGMLDRRLSGGVGIVSDDVAAGIMANLILRLLLHLFAG